MESLCGPSEHDLHREGTNDCPNPATGTFCQSR